MSELLKVFNTMSGRKERFKPLRPGKVSMFVCGPTVQSIIHVGHARTCVFYDVVARYLSHVGYDVNFLMNITDFDERITQAAAASNEDPVSLASRFSDAFLKDVASLKCTSVSRFEPVSSHIGTMLQQVATLIDIGAAYVADGWVYFDTSKFKSFGRLSHLSRKELALRPLELSVKKRHLTDFGLWRPEVLVKGKWESPWGLGSPGWHIQDTAVTMSILGPQYDIHGGAYELIYPHHEAEIAQAESLSRAKPFVKYWVHTHHVNMKGKKMSKSLGNILTVRDALAQYSPDELRVYLLQTHYRKDMDLVGMEPAARRLRGMRRIAGDIAKNSTIDPATMEPGSIAPFEAAMNDDFDTPRAISWVESTLKKGVKQRNERRRSEALARAVAAMKILGVELLGPP